MSIRLGNLNYIGYSNLKFINLRSSENIPLTTATLQSNFLIINYLSTNLYLSMILNQLDKHMCDHSKFY